MNIKERFPNENVTPFMDKVENQLDSKSVTNPKNKEITERILSLIKRIRVTYNVADFSNVSRATLTTIDGQFQPIMSQYNNLINTNNGTYAIQIDNNFNSINLYLNAVEIYTPKKHKTIHGSISKIEDRLKKIDLEETIKEKTVEKAYSLKEKEILELEKKMSVQKEKQLELSTKLDIYVSEMNNYYKSKDKNFQNLFLDFKTKNEKTFENFSLEKTKELDLINDNYKKNYKDLLKDGNKQLERMKSITQIVASSGLSAKYSIDADIEKQSYENWRKITIFSIGVLIVISILVAMNIIDFSSQGWEAILSKFIVFTSAGTFIAYSSKVSSGHRREYLHSNQLSLEHATFEPFIESLTKDEKNILISSLAPKYFGNSSNITEKDKNDEEIKLILSPDNKLIALLIKYLQKQ